ncbi:MAG: hypothetical protein ACLUIW_01005 [Dysosmobacter welbionis]
MYEAHLRSLLSPLGIYDLEEHSASGAAVCALGTGLDTVSRRLEEIEREALTATAEGEGLARRGPCLPAAPPPSRQRNGGPPSRPFCRLTGTA